MTKHKLIQIWTLSTLALSLGALTSCGEETKQEQTHSERIIGLWEWTEVERGTIFRAKFEENSKLTDIYEASSGYTRERPREWRIQGDTLILSDQMGEDSLRIVSLQDSVMELERVGDQWPLVFHRVQK